MTQIKVCGLKTLEDALFAAQSGADMLGVHLSKRSPYSLEHDQAFQICRSLREQLGDKCPLLVGVFSDELVSNITLATGKVGLSAAQLSGHESDVMLRELRGMGFKSVQPMNKAMALDDVQYYRPQFPTDERFPSLILDVYFPDFRDASTEVAQAVRAEVPRLMLTGLFTPENVVERIQAIQPWGVEVLEGVEQDDKPGVKDQAKVKAFIDAVRSL